MLTVYDSPGFVTAINCPTARGALSDFDALCKLPPDTRMDHQRGRWAPLRHAEAIYRLGSEFERHGLSARDWQIALSADGKRMVGGVRFAGTVDPIAARAGMPASELALGFHNSNDSSRAFALAMGEHVAICANGMCSGAVTVREKHLRSTDFASLIREHVGAYVCRVEEQRARSRRFWSREVSPAEADAVFVECLRSRALGAASKVAEAVALWDEPPHEEFRARNAWCLYQALNEPAKRVSPWKQTGALTRVDRILGDVLQLS